MRCSLLVLALVSMPSLAAANAVAVDVNVDVRVNVDGGPGPIYVEPASPPPSPQPILRGSRWELGVFGEGGRFAAGVFSGGQFGARGELARQFGPLRLGVEYGFGTFTASPDLCTREGWWDGGQDVGGQVHRYGATARLRTGYLQPTSLQPHRADLGLYVEVGVGRQRILWDTGGELERSDLSLGGGFEIAGGRERVGGLDLGVRVIASPSTRAGVQTRDLGVLVGLGGRFGL